VAASRQQEQGCRAPDTTQCVTRCKNGENCEVDVFRCYCTQSRAARNRRNVNSKSSLPELALLLTARSPFNPAAFLTHQKWRGMRNARILSLWYLVVRSTQQENVNSKSSLPELALLFSARSPVSPTALWTPERWRTMRNAPFALLWHSATRGRQQEKYLPVSQVCQS